MKTKFNCSHTGKKNINKRKTPFSLPICLVQKLEADWLLRPMLDLLLNISAAQTLPPLEFVPEIISHCLVISPIACHHQPTLS